MILSLSLSLYIYIYTQRDRYRRGVRRGQGWSSIRLLLPGPIIWQAALISRRKVAGDLPDLHFYDLLKDFHDFHRKPLKSLRKTKDFSRCGAEIYVFLKVFHDFH